MRFRSLMIGLACALGAGPAWAQTPTFTYATDKDREDAKAEKAVEWVAAAQGGLLITAGNARLTAISAGLTASRKEAKNKLALEGGLAYGRSSVFIASDQNGSRAIEPDEIQRPTSTTNKGWALKGRYDRFLTDHDSLYVAALALADEPAGKDFVGGGQVGYSRGLLTGPVHTVVAEGGYDFSYENPVVGDGAPIHSGRLFAGYLGKLSDDTGLDASCEALLNVNSYDNATGEVEAFDDTRVTSKVALTTKIANDLSFRFAFESRYDRAPSPRPPFALPYAPGFVPTADELDTKVEAALILNLL
jgi:hypothetical protein